MNVLLLACYELGHQPLSLGWPSAVLEEAGFLVTPVDLAVEAFPHKAAAQAEFVGIAVPMHTALRLGVEAARQVRQLNPHVHICFYGLYAWLNADYLLHSIEFDGQYLADSIVAGEYEDPLCRLVQALRNGETAETVPGVSTLYHRSSPHLQRLRLPVPRRSGLPALENYARYMHDGQQKLAGYVETTRGCLHTCRHCPVVPIYNGRFFAIDFDTVMADIRQQVEAGARHITFGDPDFLNGPGQALKVTRSLHADFPTVTFDFTTKVEHILRHRHLFPEFRELGAAFVVSAFESVSDRVLQRLEKGHTVADMETALQILQEADIPVQPTWVPFTPWTTLDDYLTLLQWIRQHDLVLHVPPIQLSIRLLVPPGSALLKHPDVEEWLGALDAENFSYRWEHPDPRMDRLHSEVAALVESLGLNEDPYATFAAVEKLAYATAGWIAPRWTPPVPLPVPPPRLTEDWFC